MIHWSTSKRSLDQTSVIKKSTFISNSASKPYKRGPPINVTYRFQTLRTSIFLLSGSIMKWKIHRTMSFHKSRVLEYPMHYCCFCVSPLSSSESFAHGSTLPFQHFSPHWLLRDSHFFKKRVVKIPKLPDCKKKKSSASSAFCSSLWLLGSCVHLS